MDYKINDVSVRGVQLILAGRGYNKAYRSSYNKYRVLVNVAIYKNITATKTKISHYEWKPIESIWDNSELESLGYWSPRSATMSMSCWGTSQAFEAQLAFGAWLGMKKEGEEWGDYTRRVQEFVKVL